MNQEIIRNSVKYIKKHANQIVKKLLYRYKNDMQLVAIFMAGSPGAGKTEFATRLLKLKNNRNIYHINPDSYRSLFKEYTGSNSSFFQLAVSILVEKIISNCYKNLFSFLLDTTLTNSQKAELNLNRAIKRDYIVYVFYIIQDPIIAWEFTQKRERIEGRNIPKEVFASQYFNSYLTVKQMFIKFQKNVQFQFVIKDIKTNTVKEIIPVNTITEFDKHRPKYYTQEHLMKVL
jgi:predicted ABC-type ATPase